jgi:TPR repeat protein
VRNKTGTQLLNSKRILVDSPRRSRNPMPNLGRGLLLTVLGLAMFVRLGERASTAGEPNRTTGRSTSDAARGRTTVQARSTNESVTEASEYFRQGQFAESTRDYAQAMKLYRKGANQGHAPSQNNLGFLYLRGLGGTQDTEEAVKYFKDAARQNYAAAQNNLGVCYRDGLGVKADQASAAKWFLQAAEQGMAEAQNNVGVRFYRGLGMPKNTEVAIKWFTKAADQGLGSAWVNLGICYVEGRGFSKDLTKAYEYFCKAAELGDADGLLSLGFAHMQGKGVSKDLIRAYVCFDTAVTYGDSYAAQARGKLKTMMTEKQVAEAHRRSYENSKRNSP